MTHHPPPVPPGASIRASGQLVSSVGAKQAVELKATELEVIGECDPSTYPLQKKRHTLEFLRGIAHLRPRWVCIVAVGSCTCSGACMQASAACPGHVLSSMAG
jgi:aspartyl/asparaginyl-tRNA synthetase